MNTLYYGDCLTIMRQMARESIDLIYLDPPFNSNRDYNAIYKDETGRPLPDQIAAFSDLWELDAERERTIRNLPILMQEAGLDDDVAQFWQIWMDALRKSNPGLLAYLSYMVERLLPMRGLLKPTGSIYLHCDPTASHYIKVMMDGIFGHKNFRNEIIWAYTGPGSPGMRQFNRKHDTIFWYSVGKTWTFNSDAVRLPHKGGKPHSGGFKGKGKSIDDPEYARKGKVPETWWIDIAIAARSSKEYLNYATQKPLALLERIIKASSNEGDVVFDPFCGCATTLEAAHKLKRKWIGIDIAIHAIKRVAKVRLQDRLGLIEGKDFQIEGVPHTMEGARDLWQRDSYHFQKWAVEQIDGFVTSRRTGDGGVDGRLYFDGGGPDLESMILEVKGGKNVSISIVRDLRGTMEREGVPMAGLIIMDDLGERKARNFRCEMAEAGDLNVNGIPYARMQMITVADILDGKNFVTPSLAKTRDKAPVLPGHDTGKASGQSHRA